jgi:very-short-patch-repair endonuclease/predicted transcriptional regulator of viral defense system
MKGVPQVPAICPPQCVEPPIDVRIRDLAERQHSVVSLPQLQFLGLSARAVRDRVAAGRLTRIHRGVYAVGHGRLTLRGHWMAAVLAYGQDAVLSHRSAAALHGIRPDNRPKSDVTVPGRSARSRSRIDVHASTTLTAADVTTIDAIPCTSLARTLLDLAEVVNRRAVEKAINQAEVLRIFDLRAVHEVLSRAAGRRGASVLRSVLADYGGPTLTKQELEERFLALCRAARLPQPEVNAWITLGDGIAYKIDFLWRRERLAVETDGWESHGTRQAFENDRRRDRLLSLAGWTVVRFTWRDVERQPDEVTTTLARLWSARSGAPTAGAG